MSDAILTINRPHTRSALARDVRDGLFAAWGQFDRALRTPSRWAGR